ncbi:hypothetical protein GCM10027436_16370 [Actinophytocola sediminis]
MPPNAASYTLAMLALVASTPTGTELGAAYWEPASDIAYLATRRTAVVVPASLVTPARPPPVHLHMQPQKVSETRQQFPQKTSKNHPFGPARPSTQPKVSATAPKGNVTQLSHKYVPNQHIHPKATSTLKLGEAG